MFRLLAHVVEWKPVALANASYDRILTQVTELSFIFESKRIRVIETTFWRRRVDEGLSTLASGRTIELPRSA